MIILYAFIASLVIAIAATVCMKVFGYCGNKGYRKMLSVNYIVCAVLLVLCVMGSCIFTNGVNNLQNEYDDIMLYHNIVSDSTNEEVRFGHYEKVTDFNSRYYSMLEAAENSWYGVLIAADWSENMEPIEFYFRGVDYAGE